MLTNEPTVDLLKIRLQVTDESNILYFDGTLDLSQARKFRTVVDQVAGQADKKLIFDLQDLRYVDSTGLGLIISTLKERQRFGQRLEVINANAKVLRLFNITGISKFVFLSE